MLEYFEYKIKLTVVLTNWPKPVGIKLPQDISVCYTQTDMSCGGGKGMLK